MSSIPKWYGEVDGQIQAKFQAQEVRIDSLESKVSELEEALKGARRAFKELDAKVSNGGGNARRARSAPKTQRKPRPQPTGNRMHVCNVSGNPHGDEQVEHSPEELKACWSAYYAQAKA